MVPVDCSAGSAALTAEEPQGETHGVRPLQSKVGLPEPNPTFSSPAQATPSWSGVSKDTERSDLLSLLSLPCTMNVFIKRLLASLLPVNLLCSLWNKTVLWRPAATFPCDLSRCVCVGVVDRVTTCKCAVPFLVMWCGVTPEASWQLCSVLLGMGYIQGISRV